MNIQSFGAVFNNSISNITPGKWRGGSFAIAYSKINNFNNELQYSGINPSNDILHFYAEEANFQNVQGSDLAGIARGAYDTYLISRFVDVEVADGQTTVIPFYDRTFFSEFPLPEFPVEQSEVINTSGSQNQWSFSYGVNYDDRLYFGATLGIQSLKYDITKTYTERYPGLEEDIVLRSVLYEDLITRGNGINGTFGIIGRPVDQITIGVSLITPTFYTFTESYYYSVEADYDNFSMTNYSDYFDANYDNIVNPAYIEENSPYYPESYTTFYEDDATLNNQFTDSESEFSYTLNTPMRVNAGATYFINKNGFVSADIEYVDYANMRLKGKEGSLQSDNESIDNLYQSVVNLRIGAEWRIKTMRVRAGYNYQPSPIKHENADRKLQTISTGVGLRSGKYFVDLAASYKMYNSQYAPYLLENPNNLVHLENNFADIDNQNLTIALSVGLFF
ncbi:MAG: hypothetical protein HC819_21525 [Cyclobacteriaceae bacterium]|nr:hypothetical protein [Cyclobacteriaceae bacterium]